VIANQVVGIFMPQRHAIVAVIDHVLFVEAMLSAPAEVDALGTMAHAVSPDNRTLGTRTGVNSEPNAVMQLTVLHEHMVRNAPHDAVAIELADRHVPHGDV